MKKIAENTKYIRVLGLILLFSLNVEAYSIEQTLDDDLRSSYNKERDVYRHPAETLSFFGITQEMTVVELSPGSGWYTEILALYLSEHGKLITAAYDATKGSYQKRSREKYESKLSSDIKYNKVEVVNLGESLAPKGTVDAVLTFRNLHNWLGPYMDTLFNQSFDALKSGGIFGVVEHRANLGTSFKAMKKSGYVTEQLAIKKAKDAGFILVKSSEINANPKDTKNYEKGVWTLPPSYRLKDVNKSRYFEIGESDRMTLLFKKP